MWDTDIASTAKMTAENNNISISDSSVASYSTLNATKGNITSKNSSFGGYIYADAKNATFTRIIGDLKFNKSNITEKANLNSDKSIHINESHMGQVNANAKESVVVYDTNVDNAFNATAGDRVSFGASAAGKGHVGSANITSGGRTQFYNTISDGDVTINAGGDANVDNAIINGIANITADNNVWLNNVTSNVMNATSNNKNIGIIGNVVADQINMTAKNGSLLAQTNALLDGNTYNFNVANNIASLDNIYPAMDKVGYDWNLQNAINISGGRVESLTAGLASVHSNGNVTFVTPETTKGNLRLSSDGDLKINKGANVAGNLLTQADGSITTSGNIMAGFDVKAYAANDINLSKVVAGRNLELNSSKGNITIDAGNDVKGGSIQGNSTITAQNGNIVSKNTRYEGKIKANAQNADFDSTKGGSLNFEDSNIANNLTAKAHGKVGLLNSKVGNKLTAESLQNEVGITSSEVGSVDAKAKYNVRFNNSKSNGDANLESQYGAVTVKGSTIKGNADIKASGKNNKANVNIENTNINGDLKANAGNDVNIKNSNANFINANAGNNVNLDTKGNITINNSSKMSLNAANSVNITTDGNVVIDNLTNNNVVNGKNVNFNGANITTNNSNYNSNVGMNSKGDVTFTGSNNINGDLTISASKDSGFVAINGDSTKANNITVNGAQYIEAKNVETGHLQFNDFEIGHILNTTADSTGFTNGNDLYINVLNTIINSGELRPSITGSAVNVDRIIFYPTFPGGGDGTDLGGLDEDSALILGYLRDRAIDTRLGSDFAPIGFAAHEGRRGGLHHMDIGDSVYRALQEQIDTLHIADRFNIDQ